jgi:hypothetical protein
MNNDPASGWLERPEHNAVDADMRQRTGDEGDARTGLDHHQRGLKVLNFGHNPHGHMQRVEKVENMPAAARTALSVSDNGILAVEVCRAEIVRVRGARGWYRT